ncbi:Mor transcription activator family protein [Chitiniphilus eburneus]|uniref:DNA transposition protein n=1 Tax=Chitiniphilus eburneus TaxID=2571148 RepID=A0A4U0PZZ5_9NEIS|nr:Mor transcription activator family protein [Chitiniphilus eburneus]TJZ73880.1 DNA transposition protein [Chitiniphilus eburneus]
MKMETFDLSEMQPMAMQIGELPDTVQEIAVVVGLPAALKMVRQYGGTSLHIPQGKHRLGKSRYEELAQLIGADEIQRLAEHFRGCDAIYIPRCAKILRAMRDEAIRSEFDEYTREESANRAVTKLARDHDLCERRVWEILKG